VHLQLFGTAHCHLCEQAHEIVAACVARHPDWLIEQIDIAEFEEWQALYAIRIPVLYHPESKQELGWPFDQPAVMTFLETLKHD
jgi:hypothetical protein